MLKDAKGNGRFFTQRRKGRKVSEWKEITTRFAGDTEKQKDSNMEVYEIWPPTATGDQISRTV
jgi:hypothetical protein